MEIVEDRLEMSLATVPDEAIENAVECLRTLAHPLRLRIVEKLLHGRYTVGELADACGIPSHVASEHLGLMKDRGLLRSERQGRRVYYAVTHPAIEGILSCVYRAYDSAQP